MYSCPSTTQTAAKHKLTCFRRATVHQINLHPYDSQTQSTPSLQPQLCYSPPTMSRSEPARSPTNMWPRPQSITTSATPITQPSTLPQVKPKSKTLPKTLPNLDYLSFGNEAETPTSPPSITRNTQPVKPEPGPTDWEKLLGSLDNGETNIYDACYGGPPIDALIDTSPLSHLNNASTPALVGTGETPIAWSQDLWALCQTETNTTAGSSNPGLTPVNHAPSILSFSSQDDGLSGSEDFGNVEDWSVNATTTGTSTEKFRGFMVPADDGLGGFGGAGEWVTL